MPESNQSELPSESNLPEIVKAEQEPSTLSDLKKVAARALHSDFAGSIRVGTKIGATDDPSDEQEDSLHIMRFVSFEDENKTKVRIRTTTTPRNIDFSRHVLPNRNSTTIQLMNDKEIAIVEFILGSNGKPYVNTQGFFRDDRDAKRGVTSDDYKKMLAIINSGKVSPTDTMEFMHAMVKTYDAKSVQETRQEREEVEAIIDKTLSSEDSKNKEI